MIDGLRSNTQYQIQAMAITTADKKSHVNETMIKATEPGIADFPDWAIALIVTGGVVVLFGLVCCILCCGK